MRKTRFILFVVGILAASTLTTAQQGGNGPERFYNVDSYKANITLTFQYQLSQSEAEYSRSVSVSQTFQHYFTTAPGQITAADMFQIERGEADDSETGENKSQEGGMLEGVDMDAVSKALENSGVDPSVMDMLKQTKEETQSYNIAIDKYKMWMTDGVSGGDVSSSIYSKFSDEESGTIACGEGLGSGPFRYAKKYTGSVQVDSGKPDINNPNSFIILLNLSNNSYSFTADVDMPRDFKFTGNDHTTQCSESSDKPISINARSFLSIRSAGEGLIYKKPLPEGGMVLSGSEIITDRFNLWGSLDNTGQWSVRADWNIYPADMEVPEVFIGYNDEEGGKQWIPEDENAVEAKMTWKGQVKPEAIEWTLYNVSAEPGTNLNSKDRNTDFDLSFDLAEVSKGYHLVRTDYGYVIRKEGNISVGRESIRIQSLDFGAYGQLSGKIKVNGTWWEAKQEDLGVPWLPVPWDKNNNMIADEWEKQVGILGKNYSAIWDEDSEPEGQFSSGDGFTLYEEYRGFTEMGNALAKATNVQVKDQHVRMDPGYKDVFIYDQDGLFKTHYAPTNAAKLNWHYIDFDLVQKSGTLEVNPEYRCINFNSSHKLFLKDQYAIYLVNDHLSPDPKIPKDAGYNNTHASYTDIKNYRAAFPLKCVYRVSIYPTGMDNALAGLSPTVKTRVKGEILTTTVIHEVGHALGIRHHWDSPSRTITDQSTTMGVLNCALRYETSSERSNANTQNFLKTRYCTINETWTDPGTSKVNNGDNCYGQIDIKGQ